jgi:hypothetical protein
LPNLRARRAQSYIRAVLAAAAETLRCTECRLIHEAQVNADPVKSDAIGW